MTAHINNKTYFGSWVNKDLPEEVTFKMKSTYFSLDRLQFGHHSFLAILILIYS